MKWSELAQEPCSVARSVAVIGDRWTLMVLRDCFLGVRRFEDFERRLGISRSLVAERLRRLVAEGVLRRERYQDRPPRDEYRLTEKGLALHPVIMAIVHWGDVYYSTEAGPPLIHRHKACGCDFAPVTTCSACGGAVTARDVEVRQGAAPRAPAEP
jgi:DNA-binding HxlR family transcriptional regulator